MRNHVATAAFAAALVVSTSSVALAADPVPVVVGDWSGFYVGAHVGYAWGDVDTSAFTTKSDLKKLFDDAEVYEWYEDAFYEDGNWGDHLVGKAVWKLHKNDLLDKDGFGFSSEEELDGFLGGAQVGFNVQSGNFVFGLEGDISFADLEATSQFGVATSEYFPDVKYGAALGGEVSTSINWLSTVRGRVGYAFDNLLIFGSGGIAFADVEVDANIAAALVECWELEVTQASLSDSDVRVGYTIGGGLEYAFNPNWSVKGEYQYIDLGDETISFGEESSIDTDITLHVVKVGLNYKFGTN